MIPRAGLHSPATFQRSNSAWIFLQTFLGMVANLLDTVVSF
jgi:hypothetical protein